MKRCSLREWIPILPWPVWPLAEQFLLGQHVVVGSMIVLLALCGSRPGGVCWTPIFVTSAFHHGSVQSYLVGKRWCGVTTWSLTHTEWNPRASARCTVVRRSSRDMAFP